MAIAQAELGFPDGMVRATFDDAIRRDPSNERAMQNLTTFVAASSPLAKRDWRPEPRVRSERPVLPKRGFPGRRVTSLSLVANLRGRLFLPSPCST